MHTETRKLQIIEAVLKTNDDAVLQAIETIVINDKLRSMSKDAASRFRDPIGTITSEEATAMKQTIKENFEQINPDDWKYIIADTNIFIDLMKG